MVNRHRIAIVPARGGSKRIPRKNIVDFGGKPLIAWTIEAALESRLFDRVLVSTEDSEVADISRTFGATVPFLRDKHYDDLSNASDATIAALSQVRNVLLEEYEIVVQLMPNSPLRNASDICAHVRSFETCQRVLQISCVRLGWMNPWWALRLDRGVGTPLFPDSMNKRSQDLPPLYCPSGAIWVARRNILEEAGTFYGPGHRYEPISWISGVDIDEEEDFAFAQAAYRFRFNFANSIS